MIQVECSKFIRVLCSTPLNKKFGVCLSILDIFHVKFSDVMWKPNKLKKSNSTKRIRTSVDSCQRYFRVIIASKTLMFFVLFCFSFSWQDFCNRKEISDKMECKMLLSSSCLILCSKLGAFSAAGSSVGYPMKQKVKICTNHFSKSKIWIRRICVSSSTFQTIWHFVQGTSSFRVTLILAQLDNKSTQVG